ncbi:hypothetical protein ERN12_16415 [Rhodobacteraceae bacterium]|nr:hypothetical protein ERN12_16415 [Paracoccaceae bacterium]
MTQLQPRKKRNISGFSGGKYRYSSFEDFLSTDRFYTGVHTIEDGDNVLDFFYHDASSKDLAVIFHGAVQKQKISELTLPIFSGQNIPLGENVDRLLLSDSTMAVDRRLRLGWFSGTTEYDLAGRIDALLRHVVVCKKYRKVVMLGGSQGGYAALRASHELPGSLAIVWNPQVEIEKFFFKNHLSGFLEYCFGCQSYNEIPVELRDKRRLDLTKVYGSGKRKNSIILMQNIDDPDHLENHAKPLVAAMGYDPNALHLGINRLDNQTILAIGDWHGGHSLPDRNTLSYFASQVFGASGEIEEALGDSNFEAFLPESFFSNKSTSDSVVQGAADEPLSLNKALSSDEWKAVDEIIQHTSKHWYMQYSTRPIIKLALQSGYKHVYAVSMEGEGLSRLRQRIAPVDCKTKVHFIDSKQEIQRATLNKAPPNVDVFLPDYVMKPWRQAPIGHSMPSVVLVEGPFFASILLYVLMQRKHEDPMPEIIFLKGPSSIKLINSLIHYFNIEKITEKVLLLSINEKTDKNALFDVILNLSALEVENGGYLPCQ